MSEARRFLVKGLLGEGGFGRVYLAEMVSAGGFRKEVALKVLGDRSHTHPEAAVRLRDEARLLGLLRHRNIVAVDDLVRLDEGWGVVMEVVHGVDLGVLVTYVVHHEDLFPARATVEMVRGIARALEAAYTHAPSGTPLNAIHRDIKPGNVRITPEGEVKVLDFGIARADFQAREAITGDGRFGSLAYMSPERVMGDGDTAAGDVYALGIVFWECLVGRPRGRAVLRESGHEGQIDQMMDTLQHRPDLDEAIKASLTNLLRNMLDFEPADRPDAAEVGTRLRALLAHMPGEDLESVSRRVIPHIRATQPAVTPTGIAELQIQTLSEVDDTRTVDFLGSGSGSGFPENGRSENQTVSELTKVSSAVSTGADPGPNTPAPASKSSWLPWAGAAFIGMLFMVGGGLFAASKWLPQSPVPESPPVELDPSPAAPEEPAPPKTGAAPEAVEAPLPVETAPTEAVEAPLPVETAPTSKGARPTQEASPTEQTAPAPDRPSPPEPATPASTEAPPAADVPRIRAAKFATTGVDRVQASCGSATGSGTSSALVRDFPAGSCTVTVTVAGSTLTTRLQVNAPRGYTCAVTDGALACH